MLLIQCALAALVAVSQPPRLGRGWREVGEARATELVTVKFALKRDEAKMKQIEADLDEIADPRSPRWREWSDAEATRRAARPVRAALAAVASWLVGSGLRTGVALHSNVFTVSAPAGTLGSLLGTRFTAVHNNATRQRKLRAGAIHLPAHIAPHVVAVYGVYGLPVPPKPRRLRPVAATDSAVGPVELQKVYKFNVTRGTGNIKVRQAIAEFQGQYIDQDDVTAFFNALVPNRKPGDDKLYKVIGDIGSGDGVEALLDTQYIMGVAPGVKTEFWSFQKDDWCSDLKTWTSYMLNDPSDQPLVISVSYGWQGDLSQIGCTDAEVKDIDQDYMLLAQKGVSIIFSSGDSGSGEDDNGKLWPSWPASSPWITSVGATCFTGDVGSEQQASSQFGSGSGFSFQFPQTTWQARVVTNYLANAPNLPPSDSYAPKGRASADVSALGENYKVYVDGSVELVGGTSASAPFYAAVISLLNDQLVKSGKKPLGYLNKWIYQTGSLYTDITKGTDKIGRDGSTLDRGFDCTAGWDPATGFGTPVFSALLGYVLNN